MHKRILVIDDEPNIRLSFRYGLLSDEWEVDEAPSGTEAVAKAIAAAGDGNGYDLLLLDLRMPGLDGLQVLKKLHEAGLRIPAILVSAHATTDTVLQAIQGGTLDFLTKPVTPEQLRNAIREVLERFDYAKLPRDPQRPLTPDEKLKQAKYHVFREQYPEAVALLLELADGPHREEASLLLGILCEITGDFSHAEDHYLQVLKPADVDEQSWRDASQARWLFERLSG